VTPTLARNCASLERGVVKSFSERLMFANFSIWIKNQWKPTESSSAQLMLKTRNFLNLYLDITSFLLQMIVVISGDCNTNHCKLTGLDIFAVRHPKLFNLVISRLGLVTDGSEQVVLNQKPDDGGRQISLSVEMYTTDVLNILTETGGFSIVAQSSSSSGEIYWSLQK